MYQRQEEELLRLFKRMHMEDRLILLEFAALRVKTNLPGKGRLLLVSNASPAERCLLDGAAS